MRLNARSNDVAIAIRDRVDFTTGGGLSGNSTPTGMGSFDFGRLAGKDKERFLEDWRAITYVVWSYKTPIAWFTGKEWYVVKQRFSVTTSRHQGRLFAVPRQGS